MAKLQCSCLYGGHVLKTCHSYNFFVSLYAFRDPENMGVDDKIVFLSGLEAQILYKTQFNDYRVAILFRLLKNSSRMPKWHLPDSDSGSVQDDESIIKVHNDAERRLSWIWPFGIWIIGLNDRLEKIIYATTPTRVIYTTSAVSKNLSSQICPHKSVLTNLSSKFDGFGA